MCKRIISGRCFFYVNKTIVFVDSNLTSSYIIGHKSLNLLCPKIQFKFASILNIKSSNFQGFTAYVLQVIKFPSNMLQTV